MLAKAELEPILAAVVHSSLDCVVVIDEAGCVIEFNPAAEATFGYTREEAMGRPISELIVPDRLRARHEAGLARYVAGKPANFVGRRAELPAMRRDGSEFLVEMTITEVFAPGRRVFTASIRDLSSASRKELESTRRQLELAVAGAKLGVWTFDPKDFSLWYSERSRELYGLPPETLITPRVMREIVHPDDWGRLSRPYAEGYPEGPLEIEYRIVRDGEVRWLYALGAADRDEDGNVLAVNGVLMDITDRKRAEAELEEARRHLELAVEGAKIGIWTVDPRTGETWYSDRSRDLWGVGKELRLDAKTLKSYIHPDDWPIVTQSYRDNFPGDTIAHEIRVVWPSGEMRWVQSLGRALRDESGEVSLVSGIHIDVTDRKRAEEELARSRDALHQSEKLAALGSLLAGVSHELNNPLAAIVGQAEMLEEDARGTAVEARAAKIKSAAERSARIVQTFLAMARQHEPQRTILDLNELVASALEVTDYALRTAGISVRVDFGTALPPVEGDKDQLHQVLANLIVNAQQAMEKSGQFEKMLTIRTSVSQAGAVLVDLRDTGPGVPPEVAGRVFEPFFTTKRGASGTGIGLSFSLGIVQAHGGTLTLEPSRRGAHFRIALPPGTHSCIVAVRTDEQKSIAAGGKRILIAEDEAEVAETLRDLLEREGYRVTVTNDGAAALTVLDHAEFDFILSDLRMPGLSGADFYHRLTETKPHLLSRIAFITGDTLGPAMHDFLQASGRHVLEKPFTKTGVRCLLAALAGDGATR